MTIKSAVKAFALIVITVVALLGAVAAIGTYALVRPEKIGGEATPANFHLSYENVSFETADGVRLAAWYVPAAAPTKSAVIALHGYPHEKSDILPRVAFLARTYNVLLVDFRYFGGSGGAYTSLGAKETNDALAAIAYLKSRGMTIIGIYGNDIGAAIALMTLDRTNDIAAVVAESPYADLHPFFLAQYRMFGPIAPALAWATEQVAKYALGIDVAAVSPEAAVHRTRVPVLLIGSADGEVISPEHFARIKTALAGDPAAEFFIPTAVGEPEGVQFAARLQQFFDRSLSK